MENAVEAFFIAFAIFIFVIALSIGINVFSKARATSDVVLAGVEKRLSSDHEMYDLGQIGEDRVVGMETVIPNLYKYYKDETRIVFKNGLGQFTVNTDPNTGIVFAEANAGVDIDDLDYLTIYRTTTDSDDWSRSYKGIERITDPTGGYTYTGEQPENGSYSFKYIQSKSGRSQEVSVFDSSEEIARKEPWTGSITKYKDNITALLTCGTFSTATANLDYNNSDNYFFSKDFRRLKFIEKSGQEITENVAGETTNKTTTKRTITYILVAEH